MEEKRKVFDRNALVHAVLWPKGKASSVSLIDDEGVSQGEYRIVEPVMGSQLSKMIPQGFFLHTGDCGVVSMAGKPVVATVAEFDTAVVTQKREVTFEERFKMMEASVLRRVRKEQAAAVIDRKDRGPVEEGPEAQQEAAQEPESEQAGEDSTDA